MFGAPAKKVEVKKEIVKVVEEIKEVKNPNLGPI
jgi:hypothetical protein